MPDADLTKKIIDAVDQNFDAQLAFTKELVKRPSIRGQEASAQDLMAEAFHDHGYTVDRWKIDPEKIKNLPGYSPVATSYDNAWTVVGAWRPENPRGRSLAFNGHVDVVPTGPVDMWSSPPFEPYIDGDWMYGRGAGDMKSGDCAYLYAMAALRKAGMRPAGNVFMESVIEEECTGNGALSCFEQGYHADVAVIPEPSSEKLMNAQVGVIWMQVAVRGKPVHVSVAGTGSNAIEACVPLWAGLHQLEEEWNSPENHHAAFGDEPHPINVVISKVEGGEWTSSVPASCVFDVRVGVYPGTPVSEIQARLEARIAEVSRDHPFLSNSPPEISYHGFLSEGYVLEDDTNASELLGHHHKSVTGNELTMRSFTGLTDARFFGLYDNTPALVYGPHAENIHGIDERVSVSSINRVTKTLALFVADWCGCEPI